MNRRDILKSAASGVAGAALVGPSHSEAWFGLGKTENGGKSQSVAGSGYVETADHTKLYYRQWGTGSPIVFVHSWALNSDLWQYQMLHLAQQGFRCIAFDRRGHGRSSDPGKGYDCDTLSDDLATVMEQLDLRGVTLVGHSMGCAVVARYLTRHNAARTARAALIAPSLPFSLKTEDNPQGLDRGFFEQFRRAWAQDFPKWLTENAWTFFGPESSPAMVQWAIGMCLQTSLQAAIECDVAITEIDFRRELRRISVPTLVIQGDKDVSAPLEFTGKRTAALIPNCRLTIYEGAPHGIVLTHISRLNGDLLAFARS